MDNFRPLDPGGASVFRIIRDVFGRLVILAERRDDLGVGFLVFLLLFAHPLTRFLGSKEFADNAVFFDQTNRFLVWYWGVFICDALRFCVQGFLFALLKAKIILVANVLLYWGVCLIPTYLTITYLHWNPVIYAQMLVLNQVIALVGFYIWYKRGTWKQG